MSNPYGIALNRAWTEWATECAVSETTAAALYLLSENRKADEVVGKLTQGELEQVIEVVGHQFNCFPRGTLAALEDSRSTSPKASARSSPRASAAPFGPIPTSAGFPGRSSRSASPHTVAPAISS